jgi:hypothetical protein
MSMIKLGLIVLVCLSIDNPNMKWIIVSFINKVTFAMYDTIQSFCLFSIFIKYFIIIIYVLIILATIFTYCKI